jgi:hypothetical protein
MRPGDLCFYRFHNEPRPAIVESIDGETPGRLATLRVYPSEKQREEMDLESEVIIEGAVMAQPFNERLPKNGEYFVGWPYPIEEMPEPPAVSEPRQAEKPVDIMSEGGDDLSNGNSEVTDKLSEQSGSSIDEIVDDKALNSGPGSDETAADTGSEPAEEDLPPATGNPV